MRKHLPDIAKPMSLALLLGLSNLWLGALRTAAGGPEGENGFLSAVAFLNNLSTYLIYLAAPVGVLGLIAGGGMLIAGSPDGPKWLTRTAVGVGVILLSKGLTA